MPNFPNDENLGRPERFDPAEWDETKDLASHQMQCEGYICGQTYTNVKRPDIQVHTAELRWFGTGFRETFSNPEDAEKAIRLMKQVFEFAGRHFI